MQKHQKYEDHLMQAIGFDEADLEANRAGELSEQQTGDARQSDRWLRRMNWAVVLMLVVGGIWVWLDGVSGQSFLTAIVEFAGIGLVTFAVIRYFAFRRRQEAKFLAANPIPVVEGRIQLDFHTSRYGSWYRLLVADMRFDVTKQAFLAFKNGDPYRIYYAPHTKRILSVEWLREDDNLV